MNKKNNYKNLVGRSILFWAVVIAYVLLIKMLKNKRIAIFFEEENIHLFWTSSEIKWGGIKG